MISFSAPGKLFLLGEYAVLEGAPALVAAVDRRAIVRIRPADDWQLYTQPAFPQTPDADGLPGIDLYEAVLNTVTARGELPSLEVEIDTRAFFGPTGKLGLGSSAAVATALTAALAAAGELGLEREEIRELATAAHREAQGGAGSGADVAAAVHGGVVAFAASETPRALDWLPGLHAAAVITGNGADTRQLVDAVRTLAQTDPAGYRRLMRPLATLAEDGREAWMDGDAAGFLRVAGNYHRALGALGAKANAGIVLAAHLRLAALAGDVGAVFKPSGAGGGDLGLLFATSAEALARACAAAADANFDVLELGFGAPGLLE